ncbi:hypothetical protein M758_9G128200 [Ceratodon purpureus]|nr:hypothetical protein M758_9G128200 [Ceratodon purpureus]
MWALLHLHLPWLFLRAGLGVLVLRLCWWCWRICEPVEVVLYCYLGSILGACLRREKGSDVQTAVRSCSGRAISFRERVLCVYVCVELEAVPVCGLAVDLVYPD